MLCKLKGWPEMNTEDMDYYEYEEAKKRFSVKKIIKLIFKLLAAAIIVTVFVLIFGRIIFIRIPKEFTGLTWTDAALELYSSDKDFDYIYYPLGETYGPSKNTQQLYSSDTGKTYTVTEGLYHVSNIAMSETTGEVQFTVRYNKRSTVNALMEHYGLTERPEGEIFVYRLTDSFGNVYTDYVFAEESNLIQEYRRIVFRNVDLSSLIADVNPADTVSAEETEVPKSGDKLTLHIYYGEDVSENRKMNATFTLYDSEMPYTEPVFNEIGNKTELLFTDAPYYESHLH